MMMMRLVVLAKTSALRRVSRCGAAPPPSSRRSPTDGSSVMVVPVVVLSSSPPPVRSTPRPASTTSAAVHVLSSSPLPPSPTTFLRDLKSTHSNSTQDATSTAGPRGENRSRGAVDGSAQPGVWEIPDDDAASLPLRRALTSKPKRSSSKPTAGNAAKKPRASKAGKRGKPNATIAAKVVKSSFSSGTSSKYFAGDMVDSVNGDNDDQAFVEKRTEKSRTSRTNNDSVAASEWSLNERNQSGSNSRDAGSGNVLLAQGLEDGHRSPSPPLLVRRQWTPVQDTPVSLESVSPSHNRVPFAEIVNAMRYSAESQDAGSTSRSISGSTEDEKPAMRKRHIEMIENPLPAPQPARSKASASRPRKAQTITEWATAKYRTTTGTDSSLLQHFPVQEKAKPGRATTSKEPIRARASAKPKALPKKRRKKGEDEPPVILLSPKSAQKRFDDQAFVFGTCSQLEKDESDTDGDSFVSLPPTSPLVNTVEKGAADLDASGRSSSSRLWDAAARDLDGGLMQVDVMDLTRSRSTSQATAVSKPNDTQTAPFNASPPAQESSQINGFIDALPALTAQHNSQQADQDDTVMPTAAKRSSRPKTTAAKTASVKPSKAPSSEHLSSAAPIGTSKAGSKPPPRPKGSAPEQAEVMPDFTAYSNTRLQAELARFGFKTIKGRDLMIEWMQKCWQAQHQPKPIPSSADIIPTTTTTTAAATTLPGPGPSSANPSSTRRRKTPTRRQQQQQPQDLTRHHHSISQAVRQASGHNDPDSFYYRILMYDPIILEDLTMWLNTTGLGLVGVDEEVGIAEVRAWCDANGVCCLNKDTNRGLERKRY